MRAPRVTSRDYKNPRRPAGVGALHAVWRGVGAARRPTLAIDALEAAARRAEGLSDFGDGAYREPLTRLLDAIEAEAHLHPLGRVIVREHLLAKLRNRLRAEAWFAEHPEILARPLVAPIVITGLPRTGTTFLQRLLSADPRIRSMRSWEGANPAPFRGAVAALGDTRRLRARAIHGVISTMAPDFLACHPIELDGIDEEIILLDHSLLSSLPEVLMHVPSYATWQEAQHQGPAYRMLRRLLLLLDWQRAPAAAASPRWLLKTPQHLECLDELFEVFPDAVVVQCHRDPKVAVASTCSMVAHARGFVSDTVDPAQVGARTLGKLATMIERMAEGRARRGQARFVDVAYDALLADPVGQARRVLTTAGMEWTPAAEASITAESANRERERFGRHVYALEDFSLSPGDVAQRFGPYLERFQLSA